MPNVAVAGRCRCRSASRRPASRSLPGPGEHPRRADEVVVADGRRSRRCSRRPTAPRSKPSEAHRLRRCRSASRPAASRSARAGEHPGRPDVVVVAGAADQGGAPVARQRHGEAEDSRRRSAPLPVSFAPCCVQVAPERVNTHAAPMTSLSNGPPIERRVPVRRERDARSRTRPRRSRRRRGQLRALLRPGRARAREDPRRRPTTSLSSAPADQGGVPVGRQRDAVAELAGADARRRRSASRLAASRRRPSG